jgi:hypothetical protein
MGESSAPAQSRSEDPRVSRLEQESPTVERSSPVAVVEAYATAKSSGDVEGALAVVMTTRPS